MCKRAMYSEAQAKEDYNARLGYGTDQGRWLVDQVGGKETEVVRRPARQPSRVFHDANDMAPAPPMHQPVPTEPSGLQLLCDSTLQVMREVVQFAKDNPEDTAIMVAVAFVALLAFGLILWMLLGSRTSIHCSQIAAQNTLLALVCWALGHHVAWAWAMGSLRLLLSARVEVMCHMYTTQAPYVFARIPQIAV
eukprot:CAMPEP_0119078566 /NCGR_PEP_ID=MMETSP1178-20130426/101625_1 /TAXON_ID=33656 /ORGANISM="unid sp, Strain CCMP2000" /LENGTH=192 /DNA_ID=CAMNT_0007061019 /DNA_START=60 /DNA_END=639 /DNA_ORIENTATION=+